MVRYYQPVDKRSRREMVVYLSEHFRYSTLSHWNGATSYAHNMKLSRLDLDADTWNKLFDLLYIDEFAWRMQLLRQDFAQQHNYIWQAGMNGRSGGYLVLYSGEKRPSGYKSYCTACGQQNYTSILESGTKCGRCGEASRTDYSQTHMNTVTFPGRSIDQYEDFDEWSMDELRDRVEVVQSFGILADDMVAEAISIAKSYSIEEEVFFVERTRKVMVPAV